MINILMKRGLNSNVLWFFSELKKKIIPFYKFLKFVSQVTIKFWFRKALTKKRL